MNGIGSTYSIVAQFAGEDHERTVWTGHFDDDTHVVWHGSPPKRIAMDLYEGFVDGWTPINVFNLARAELHWNGYVIDRWPGRKPTLVDESDLQRTSKAIDHWWGLGTNGLTYRTKVEIRYSLINRDRGYRFFDGEWEDAEVDDPDDDRSIFRGLQRAWGRCISRMYRDSIDGTKAIGWVFEKRMVYEDARSKDDTYIREAWVEVRKIKVPVSITETWDVARAA